MLNKILFLTAKPVVYLVNMSTEDYVVKKNKWLGKVRCAFHSFLRFLSVIDVFLHADRGLDQGARPRHSHYPLQRRPRAEAHGHEHCNIFSLSNLVTFFIE